MKKYMYLFFISQFLVGGAGLWAMGASWLFDAAEIGDVDLVRRLMVYAPEGVFRYGFTLLHVAAEHGHKEVVEALVREYNVDVNTSGRTGATPLYLACQNGHSDIVEFLVHETNVLVDKPKTSMATPLYIACQKGYLAIVMCLVRAGARVDAPGPSGTLAVFVAIQNGHMAIVQFLLGSTRVVVRDAFNRSVLHYAALGNDLRMIEYLIEHGAPRFARDSGNATPLTYALSQGHTEVALLLIRNGAEICEEDLWYAYTRGHFKELSLGLIDYIRDDSTFRNIFRAVIQRILLYESWSLQAWLGYIGEVLCGLEGWHRYSFLQTDIWKLCAFICRILFPDLEPSQDFVVVGEEQIEHLRTAQECLVDDGIPRDVVALIFFEFLPFPKIPCFPPSR